MGALLSSELLEFILAVISGVATALGGAAASGLFEKVRAIFKKTDERSQISSQVALATPTKRVDIARKQVYVRIGDAQSARSKLRRTAIGANWSSNLLTIGQYVVGAALTTSFIQKELAPNLIGIFGVIVVISSAFKQHYRPEVAAQVASEQMAELDNLIRQSEDGIVVIDTKADPTADDPEQLLELLERITAEIARITSNSPRQTAQRTRKGK